MTKRNSTANVGADAYENGAGGGGGVQSVNQGPGIEVNNVDPLNPIVSADIEAAFPLSILAGPGNAQTIYSQAIANLSGSLGTAVATAPNAANVAAVDLTFETADVGISPGAFYRGLRYIGLADGTLDLAGWQAGILATYPDAERGAAFYVFNRSGFNVNVQATPGDLFNGLAAPYIVPPGQNAICIWTNGADWACGLLPAAQVADQLVKSDLADQTADYLFPKLVAGGGINLSVVSLGPSFRAVLIASTDIATGFPNGQQLYEFATNEAEAAIKRDGALSPPAGSGDNSGTRGFGFVADRTMNAAAARIWISQVGGSNMRLGLYNSAGNRIAQTNRFSPAVGIIQAAFTAPVVLTGGQLYYMAFWCDDTTSNLRFLVITGRSTTSTSPLMQRHDPNEMPASIASGISNTSGRPWLMITE